MFTINCFENNTLGSCAMKIGRCQFRTGRRRAVNRQVWSNNKSAPPYTTTAQPCPAIDSSPRLGALRRQGSGGDSSHFLSSTSFRLCTLIDLPSTNTQRKEIVPNHSKAQILRSYGYITVSKALELGSMIYTHGLRNSHHPDRYSHLFSNWLCVGRRLSRCLSIKSSGESS